MLDAPVAGKVENCLLAEHGIVEIAGVGQQLVVFSAGLGDDLAIGIDDQAAGNHVMPILAARLGDGHDPGRILVGTGL